jgi:hypothetical protein
MLKNAVTDPAQDFMIANPMSVGSAVVKAAPKAAGLVDDTLGALKRARTPAPADDMDDWMAAAERALGGKSVSLVDEAASAPFKVNASGESAASLESMGRKAWEKTTGRRPVTIDRAGRETPFVGEIGDDALNLGSQRGYRYPDGRFERIK